MGLDILFDTEAAVLAKPVVSIPVDAAREANHRIANVLTLLSSSVRTPSHQHGKEERVSGE